jgi:hypothetical protein
MIFEAVSISFNVFNEARLLLNPPPIATNEQLLLLQGCKINYKQSHVVLQCAALQTLAVSLLPIVKELSAAGCS